MVASYIRTLRKLRIFVNRRPPPPPKDRGGARICSIGFISTPTKLSPAFTGLRLVMSIFLTRRCYYPLGLHK
jgi:hypothetical protein